MTPEELEKREARAREGDWIITEVEDGFRIYSPQNRSRTYRVTGLPNEPACTCPDFEHHAQDPEWRCKHILAVQRKIGVEPTTRGQQADGDAADNGPPKGSHVLIKRSVSPDGKIDALSVELSAPVDGATAEEAEIRAGRMLALGDRIVDRFLEKNGGREREGRSQERREPSRTEPQRRPNDATPAELMTVRGEDGKWGRRLYMTVRTDDGYLRLYGSESQLAEHLREAGYPELSNRIEEDVSLRVPCRIATERNEDGYVEITRVLPPAREGREAEAA